MISAVVRTETGSTVSRSEMISSLATDLPAFRVLFFRPEFALLDFFVIVLLLLAPDTRTCENAGVTVETNSNKPVRNTTHRFANLVTDISTVVMYLAFDK